MRIAEGQVMTDLGRARRAGMGNDHDGVPSVTRNATHVVTALSDATLLAQCRAGNGAAWSMLVSRYQRLVMSVGIRSGLGRDDAADVCQMTFVALLESIDDLRDDDRLAGWLMTAGRRLAWKTARRRDREYAGTDRVELAAEPIRDWELEVSVHNAIARLDEPCRSLLIALFFDPSEPSYSTVAARFGRSIGGIGPLRGRCLDRVRSLMGEDARTW